MQRCVYATVCTIMYVCLCTRQEAWHGFTCLHRPVPILNRAVGNDTAGAAMAVPFFEGEKLASLAWILNYRMSSPSGLP